MSSDQIREGLTLIVSGLYSDEEFGTTIDIENYYNITDLENPLSTIVKTVRAEKAGEISGVVQLLGQKDHTGIDVYIPGTPFMAKTDGDGNYLIKGIPRGIWPVLRAEKDGYIPLTISDVNILSDKKTEIVKKQMMIDKGINGEIFIEGDEIVDDLEVLVSLDAEGATLYQLSESEDFIDAKWQVYTKETSFTFESSGRKTLYARFTNANGLESGVYTDEVIIEQSPPLYKGFKLEYPLLTLEYDEPETAVAKYHYCIGTADNEGEFVSCKDSNLAQINLGLFDFKTSSLPYLKVKAMNQMEQESSFQTVPLFSTLPTLTLSYQHPWISLDISDDNPAIQELSFCLYSDQGHCNVKPFEVFTNHNIHITKVLDGVPLLQQSHDNTAILVRAKNQLGVFVDQKLVLDSSSPTGSLARNLISPAHFPAHQIFFNFDDSQNQLAEILFKVSYDGSDSSSWQKLSNDDNSLGWLKDGFEISDLSWLNKTGFDGVSLRPLDGYRYFPVTTASRVALRALGMNIFGMKSAMSELLLSNKKPSLALDENDETKLLAENFLSMGGVHLYATDNDCSDESSCEKYHIKEHANINLSSYLSVPVKRFAYAINQSSNPPSQSEFTEVKSLNRSSLRDIKNDDNEEVKSYEKFIPYEGLIGGSEYSFHVRGISSVGQLSPILSSKSFRYQEFNYLKKFVQEPYLGSSEYPTSYVDYSASKESPHYQANTSLEFQMYGVVRGRTSPNQNDFYVALVEMPDPLSPFEVGLFLAVLNERTSSWYPLYGPLDVGRIRKEVHPGICHMDIYQDDLSKIAVGCGDYRAVIDMPKLEYYDGNKIGYSNITPTSWSINSDNYCSPKIWGVKAIGTHRFIFMVGLGNKDGTGNCTTPNPTMRLYAHDTTYASNFASFNYSKVHHTANDWVQLYGMDVISAGSEDKHVFTGLANYLYYVRYLEGKNETSNWPVVISNTGGHDYRVTAIHAISSNEILAAVTDRYSSARGFGSRIYRLKTADSWATFSSQTVLWESSKDNISLEDDGKKTVITRFVKPNESSDELYALVSRFNVLGGGGVRKNYRYSQILHTTDRMSDDDLWKPIWGNALLTTPISHLDKVDGFLSFASIGGEFVADYRCSKGTVVSGDSCEVVDKGAYTDQYHSSSVQSCSNALPTGASYKSKGSRSSVCEWVCDTGYGKSEDGLSCVADGDPGGTAFSASCTDKATCACPEDVSVGDLCNGGIVIKKKSDRPVTLDHIYLQYRAAGNDSQSIYSAAQSYCNGLSSGGKTDWRLPYAGIIGGFNPSLATTARSSVFHELSLVWQAGGESNSWSGTFNGVVADTYWTSNLYATNDYWLGNLNDGTITSHALFNTTNYFRCVRGGGR